LHRGAYLEKGGDIFGTLLKTLFRRVVAMIQRRKSFTISYHGTGQDFLQIGMSGRGQKERARKRRRPGHSRPPAQKTGRSITETPSVAPHQKDPRPQTRPARPGRKCGQKKGENSPGGGTQKSRGGPQRPGQKMLPKRPFPARGNTSRRSKEPLKIGCPDKGGDNGVGRHLEGYT